jgi:hypothetical protein
VVKYLQYIKRYDVIRLQAKKSFLQLNITFMSLFENLLQIKTKKKKHLIKAVFVPNAAV